MPVMRINRIAKDSGRHLEGQGDGADNNKSKVVHAKRIMTTRQDARTVVRRAFQPDFVWHCQAGKPDVLSIPAGGCMMELAGQRQELSKTTQEVRAADNQVYASLVEIVTGRSAIYSLPLLIISASPLPSPFFLSSPSPSFLPLLPLFPTPRSGQLQSRQD